MSERFDLYTGDRKKTDRTMLRGEPVPAGYYRLVMHICIFNSSGELLIQQRQENRPTWPGLWDVSVGGHVIVGEQTRDAAERELWEELGLKASFQEARPALSISFENGFDDYFILNMDVPLEQLRLQTEEVQQAKWASKEEIVTMIEEGSFIPYHKSLIGLLFDLRDRQDVHQA